MTEKFNIDVSLFNDLFYKTCMYNPLLSGVYHLGGDAIPFLVNDFFSYRRDDKLGFIVHNRDIQIKSDFEVLQNMGIQFDTEYFDVVTPVLNELFERGIKCIHSKG